MCVRARSDCGRRNVHRDLDPDGSRTKHDFGERTCLRPALVAIQTTRLIPLVTGARSAPLLSMRQRCVLWRRVDTRLMSMTRRNFLHGAGAGLFVLGTSRNLAWAQSG